MNPQCMVCVWQKQDQTGDHRPLVGISNAGGWCGLMAFWELAMLVERVRRTQRSSSGQGTAGLSLFQSPGPHRPLTYT